MTRDESFHFEKKKVLIDQQQQQQQQKPNSLHWNPILTKDVLLNFTYNL